MDDKVKPLEWHIELGKRIEAARRGEGPMPSMEELNEALQSIIAHRVNLSVTAKPAPRKRAVKVPTNADELVDDRQGTLDL